MRGDVSFIDDVLHLAANLRMNSIVPGDHEVVSMHDNKSTSLADAGTTAGSLLAQGTAVDLEIVQNNVAHLDKQHPVSLGQRLDSANERAIKRRRLGEIDSIEVEDGSNGQSLPQRLASRDAMPPPPGHFLDTMVRDPNPCLSFGQANGHKRTSTPAVSCHGHSPHPGGCEYRSSSTYLSSLQRLSIEPEQGSSDTLGSTASARSSFYWKQQESDGELDQSTSLPLLRGFPSHISPPKRLTLPPRTPSNTNQATSHGQVGILAHARTSQPYSQTPGDLRPFQRRHSGYATNENSQPAASPYFGNRPLITSLPAQNPYTNRPAFQAYQQTPSRTPSIKSALVSSHPTSNQLPWLTSSLRQGPNPNIKGASMAELQSGSDGHRQSTNSRHLTNQRFSLNSIPIMQQSQIDGGEGGQNAKVPSVNHGRRAARR
ncbi:MAG: hypothetical protein Q9203_001217 [Teloschistes exilis]